jgi:ribosomal protein S18 acetylase RimI-like enzyme
MERMRGKTKSDGHPHITIEKPRLSDAPIIVKWGRDSAVFKDCSCDEWYPARVIRQWIVHPQKDIILIAKDGKKPVGMFLAHDMRHWVYCSTLYVEKSYRSKGIGSMLLAKIVDIAKKRNYMEVSLMVNKNNRDAKKFYLRNEFHKGYLFRWMGKKL